jgi:hypothetical protein
VGLALGVQVLLAKRLHVERLDQPLIDRHGESVVDARQDVARTLLPFRGAHRAGRVPRHTHSANRP